MAASPLDPLTATSPKLCWADCDPELDDGPDPSMQVDPSWDSSPSQPKPVQVASAYEGKRPLNRAHVKLDELHDRGIATNTAPRVDRPRRPRRERSPPRRRQRQAQPKAKPQVDEDGWTTVVR